MSIAKFDPNLVKATWGPILLTGFEAGEFISAALNVPDRYTFKSAFGRSIHTLSTDTSGIITMRFQGDSPSLALIMAQIKIDQAPGGNVVLPIMVKDNNGFDVVVSPLARIVNIPALSFNDGDQSPREFMWRCEPLEIFHGGIASVNG